MELRVVTSEEAELLSHAALGCAPRSEAGIAELLRIEALGSGGAQRHRVIERVSAWLGAEAGVKVAPVLESLERLGDVVSGSGGLLAPAPTRVVELPSGGCVLLGSISTQAFLQQLGEGSVVPGVPRRVSASVPREKLLQTLEALGGRLLSLEQWARLDRWPAGQAFLDDLDRRLGEQPASELLDLRELRDVQYYVASLEAAPPRRRWRFGEGVLGPLVRSQGLSWPVFGWASPAAETPLALPLTRDEASRALWLLAARAEVPIQITSRPAGEGRVQIAWPTALPLAEWRLLRLLDESRGSTEPGATVLSEDALDEVQAMLVERLGAVFVPGELRGTLE